MKTKKFYTTSCLVYAIVYFHIFEDLPRAKNIHLKKDPVSFCYPILWKQKSPYHLYEVKYVVLSSFKKLICSPAMSRFSLEVASFLSKKWIFETMEYSSFIRLYGFQGKYSPLPFYVSDKNFSKRVELRSCFNFLNVSITKMGSSLGGC